MQILVFVVGCLLGAIAMWLAVRSHSAELRKSVSDAREREQQQAANAVSSARDLTNALMEKAAAQKEAEGALRRADEMIAQERGAQQRIIKAKDEQIAKLSEFTNEFKAISGDVLKDVSEQLSKRAEQIIERHDEKTAGDVRLHKQQIETMLKPVEETIKRLDKHVEASNLARSNAEALLEDQINRLAGASESLAGALRKPVVRGSWGETTLENALENAGLRSGIDFVLQHSTDGEDGRKRTDAVVRLPKGRRLVIDSKNLMESYIAYSIEEEPAKKAFLAEAHAKSLRAHVKDLASKRYWERYDGLDCVILFLPHDGMYHAAIQDEAELIRDACEKRVFVTNPMSLIFLLKAVGYVLDQERANKSAKAIRNLGAELYGELARFAAGIANIGSKLQASVKAYNEVIPGLDRFIVAKSRKLKQLGAAKGPEPELPEPVELESRAFSSPELNTAHLFLQEESELSLAAAADPTEEK
jgi:DNA recombination protein RmuC